MRGIILILLTFLVSVFAAGAMVFGQGDYENTSLPIISASEQVIP